MMRSLNIIKIKISHIWKQALRNSALHLKAPLVRLLRANRKEAGRRRPAMPANARVLRNPPVKNRKDVINPNCLLKDKQMSTTTLEIIHRSHVEVVPSQINEVDVKPLEDRDEDKNRVLRTKNFDQEDRVEVVLITGAAEEDFRNSLEEPP
ncbi:MAG: hypothetical protein GY737_29540, partial [Desulfobacteraceae bacterium]|nr:hypothetical protein [Desulfobacteraceae bacterium]